MNRIRTWLFNSPINHILINFYVWLDSKSYDLIHIRNPVFKNIPHFIIRNKLNVGQLPSLPPPTVCFSPVKKRNLSRLCQAVNVALECELKSKNSTTALQQCLRQVHATICIYGVGSGAGSFVTFLPAAEKLGLPELRSPWSPPPPSHL